jgi:PLP dependent protein
MSSASETLTANLSNIRDRIEIASARAGRRADAILLIAVSKTHTAKKIRQLYAAGVRHFGENRVQERETKLPQLTDLDATWHMIGHLQKNKAARAASLFDSIDSIDSIVLAEKIDRAIADLAAVNADHDEAIAVSKLAVPASRRRVLIEVKLDPEPAKSGVAGGEVERLAEAILRLRHLDLRGLLGVPPFSDNPEEARPHFRHLRELRDRLCARLGADLLPVLSMGMSHDFEVAIEEGATEVRIGTALFGDRDTAQPA